MTARQFVLLIFCATVTTVTSQYEEGTPCEIGDDVGTCLLPEKCDNKNAPYCAIKNYVCCTKRAESRGREKPAIRKSVKACSQIIEDVGPPTIPQILGGTRAELGEFPHMAALGYVPSGGGSSNVLNYTCGGSLISDQFVLTAAHCLNPRGGPPVQVRLGKVDIYGNSDETLPKDFNILQITPHPNYNRQNFYNDIGLIKLSGKVKYNVKTVFPACLHQNPVEPPNMSVTGWGKQGTTGDGSTRLLKAKLSSVSFVSCKFEYLLHPISRVLIEQQICAKSANGTQDTCEGDSGGPMQIKSKNGITYDIVGITSFGKPCDGKFPGVYTKVHSYLDWIERIVWP